MEMPGLPQGQDLRGPQTLLFWGTPTFRILALMKLARRLGMNHSDNLLDGSFLSKGVEMVGSFSAGEGRRMQGG